MAREMSELRGSPAARSGELSDDALVGAAAAGDDDAFAALVSRHLPRLYGLAVHLLDDREEAEDATQEVLLRAHAHLPSFRGSSSVATWLYRIAVNVCRDMLRRRQVRQRAIQMTRIDRLWADERYAVDPERIVLAAENQQLIEHALRCLPPLYRATVLLHEVDGLTLSEIAAMLQTPLPTVKSRLQRARMALVTLLDEATPRPPAPRDLGPQPSESLKQRLPPAKSEGEHRPPQRSRH
jgi:RNA polymerase sigma-70 factor (ECF subfamily)